MNSHEKFLIEHFSVLLDDWLKMYQQTRTPEMIAKIVHEIKNPISLIKSTLQLIECQTPEAKNNPHWSLLYEELDYICLLVNDFSSLNNSFNIKKDYVDIISILISVKEAIYSLAYSKNINITMNSQDDFPIILGDKMRLKEAFMNLIKNAIEAVDSDGTITITTSYTDSHIKVIIADNGLGIKSEQLNEIFKPFITYKENGTGLGLPIVKSIIAQHQGNITIQSELNKGTSFIISLPINT
ncbi:MAG: HAMP domain-containing histidine kinase [Vallitalea sp.]|jgi:signal transduction histidine kinase|nr:HAMP domain-containing histidine kinase [Vallitalea sp.]